MNIHINGEDRTVTDGITVGALLGQLEIRLTHVVVELNEQILPRDAAAQTPIPPDARIEIVHFVGGG